MFIVPLGLYRPTIMLKEITANELLGLFENYNEVLCKNIPE